MATSARGSAQTVHNSMRRERLGAAAVYAAGAVLYVIARELLGLNFLASPLFLGVVLLVASTFRPRLLASAVLLICWGTAVLLDGHGPFAADRSAAVYMTGFGVGALVLLLLRQRIDARTGLEAIASVMLVAGVWFYLAYDYDVLESVWLWAASLLLTAAALVAQEITGWPAHTRSATRG